MRPWSRDDFEIAIICALPLEFDAVEALFDDYYDEFIPAYGKKLGDANWYRAGRIAEHSVLLTCLPGMGIGSAASVASSLKVSFPRINLALLVGICGAVPHPSERTEIILGDVVISDRIVEYGFGRQYPDGFQPRGIVKETLGRSNRDLRTFLSGLTTHRMRAQLQSDLTRYVQGLQHHPGGRWQYPGISQDQLFEPSYRHKHYHLHPNAACLCINCHSSTDPVCDEALESDCRKLGCVGGLIPRTRLHAEHPSPQIHFGSLASADMVMKSGEHRDRLAETEKVVGFEMEGAGVCDTFPCIIIKGVCDYADSHKNKIWQNYASATAASCAKAFLQSWPATCQERSNSTAQLTLANAVLRKFYESAKRLDIQRISGKQLPMDQCYINLAIVEHSLSIKMPIKQKSSPFSLFNRLKIETVDNNAQVPLQTLFDPRKQSEDKIIQPKRILIQGRAGVGKTTLCKKIVYDYLYHGMWEGLFDWVLWVPLRKLKLRSSSTTYNMENLFYDEYFSQHPEGRTLARVMWTSLNESPARGKTLFILDGLDEVSQDWVLGDSMDEFLNHLLGQPQVIITTRPQTLNRNNLEPLDLELETIGFLPEQVTAYIERMHDETVAEQIQKFINSRWLIRGLVRIPIQLDALCYSWNHDFQSDGGPKNMTALYQAIMLELWKKDIRRLEKFSDGKRLTEADILHLRTAKQIEHLVRDEAEFLESLAFSGLYSNLVDFNTDYRDEIIELLPSKALPLSDNVLAKLSFLRTSDSALREEEKSYHFLHLTFQEFFAASHFVRQWISKESLFCFTISDNHAEIEPDVKPYDFLQKEKYNARYNIFWRFVTGLLQSCRDKEHLLRFLRVLDSEPRDLLGPTHQRLLMHCFSELPAKPHLEQFRKEMEVQLTQWAVFEHKLTGKMKLCREIEFPDDALVTMMNEEQPEDVKNAILEALWHRSNFSSCLLKQVVSFLRQNVSNNLKRSAIDALGRQTSLPHDVLQAIVRQLEESDRDVRWSAVEALGKQTTLSDDILQAIIHRLEHSDWDVRQSAITAFNKQPTLLDGILQAIVHRLEHFDRDVRWSAINALGKQPPTLSDDVLDAIVRRLEDSDRGVQQSAVKVLNNQTALSDNILQAIVCRLEHSKWNVQQSVIDFLGKQTTLPDNILQAIVCRLEHSDKFIRQSAIDALGRQASLSDSVLQAIVCRLEDSDWDVRQSVIIALGKQPALSDYILKAIVCGLEHSDKFMRRFSIDILGKQTALPDNILQAIVRRLEDSDRNVRQFTIDALSNQTILSDSILQAIVRRLEDSDWIVRRSAIFALGKHSALLDDVLQTMMCRLEDSDWDVRRSAIDTLSKRNAQSDNILQAIVHRLEDSDWIVRQSAIMFFSNQTTLSDDVLQAIVCRLEDSDWIVRRSAIYALGKQTALSDDILQAIVHRLEDSDWIVRQSAIIFFSNQTTLSDDVLQAIVCRLEDSDWIVRQSAINFFSNQTTLSDDVLQAIVCRLEDSDQNVRWSAIKALGKQTMLSDDILQAIIHRLEHSDGDVRQSAINAFNKQPTSSDDIFQAILHRLQDSDWDERWSVIDALGNETALSDNVLQAVVRVLSKDTNINSKSVRMLLTQDNLYVCFPTFDVKTLRSLYKLLVWQSFSEQLSCYRQDGVFYINMLDRQRKISLVQNNDVFLDAFREEAGALEMPGSLDHLRLR